VCLPAHVFSRRLPCPYLGRRKTLHLLLLLLQLRLEGRRKASSTEQGMVPRAARSTNGVAEAAQHDDG